MVKSMIAFALLSAHTIMAEPLPLRGGRAAMEFELAAREMRRADEEIKAAAWDEQNSGRTPAVDAAVAELAHAARNVAQVTAKVVAEVSAQPEKKPRAQPGPKHHTLQGSTDEVVQAIAQHSHERKIKKAIAASTDEASKAIKQHSAERAHRKAMNSAADAVADAIKRHTTERNQRTAMELASDIMVHGVAQNSHERAVVDATRAAENMVRLHLEDQNKDVLAKDSDRDEDTFQDLAQDAA